MHPFCCVSSAVADPMTPPPPSQPPSSSTVTGVANCSNTNNNHHNHNKSADHNHLSKHNRSQNSHSNNQSPNRNNPPPPLLQSGSSQPPSRREIAQLTAASGSSSGVAKINDIVGNGISGILNKWVNYGKGWRPRWFLLQDGVLSYYKIHGPDKIVLNQEIEKGARLIGEESFRRVSRPLPKNSSSSPHKNRSKPVGEIHLKVSSIRESRSDDKRFSIFTGTKRLHLRAESREDRMAWMDALQAVKDMFPRMSNSELMAPLDSFTISTDKLRQRLMEEGVSEAAIQDSEQIMRNDFASLQNQLMLLKQKHWLLMDTLRQLEVHVMISRKRLANPIHNSSVSS